MMYFLQNLYKDQLMEIVKEERERENGREEREGG